MAQVPVNSIWERLSQPRKSRLQEALEAASGMQPAQNPEIERVRSDPGQGGPTEKQEFERAQSSDQTTQPQAKSSLRMKLRRAVRMTLNMTRFRTQIEELQVLVRAARPLFSSLRARTPSWHDSRHPPHPPPPPFLSVSVGASVSVSVSVSASVARARTHVCTSTRPLTVSLIIRETRTRFPRQGARLMPGSYGIARLKTSRLA